MCDERKASKEHVRQFERLRAWTNRLEPCDLVSAVSLGAFSPLPKKKRAFLFILLFPFPSQTAQIAKLRLHFSHSSIPQVGFPFHTSLNTLPYTSCCLKFLVLLTFCAATWPVPQPALPKSSSPSRSTSLPSCKKSTPTTGIPKDLISETATVPLPPLEERSTLFCVR